MIFVFGIVFFRMDAASAPPNTGIERSRSISSGCSFFALSMASTPWPASADFEGGLRLDIHPEKVANAWIVVYDQDASHVHRG